MTYEAEQQGIFIDIRRIAGQTVVQLRVTRSTGGLSCDISDFEIEQALSHVRSALGLPKWEPQND